MLGAEVQACTQSQVAAHRRWHDEQQQLTAKALPNFPAPTSHAKPPSPKLVGAGIGVYEGVERHHLRWPRLMLCLLRLLRLLRP